MLTFIKDASPIFQAGEASCRVPVRVPFRGELDAPS